MITSGRDLDYTTAYAAAARIQQICEDAAYIAPESLDVHQIKINEVCRCLDAIVKALRIRTA